MRAAARVSDRRCRTLRMGAGLTLLAALTSCSGYTPAATVRRGGTLIFQLDAYPTSLNPLVAGDVSSVRAYAPLFPHLYGLDAGMRLQPDLAVGPPEAVDGGRSWTVRLNPAARWTDGRPISSADVVYTVETERSPSLDTRASFDWSELNTVTAPDPSTVTFSLAAADASFPANHLAFPIVPRHVLSGTAAARMSANVYGSLPRVTGGPFKLDFVQEGRVVAYITNPHYYGRPPNIDRLQAVVSRDQSTIVQLLSAGSILWAPGMTAAAADSARGVTAVRVSGYPDLGYYALTFNARPHRVFAPLQVRQALADALDRAAVTRSATGGHGVVMWGTVNPASWAYDPAAAPPTGRDASAATRLLAGATIESPLLIPDGDGGRAAAAAEVAREARVVGINLVPTPLAPATFADRLARGDFEVALTANGQAPDPDASVYLRTGGALNFGGFSDPALDGLLDRDRTALGPTPEATVALRRPLLAQVEERVASQLPLIPLWSTFRYQGFNETVQGVGTAGNQLDQDRDSTFFARWFLSA